jgi:GT2 family glycosyltransferase
MPKNHPYVGVVIPNKNGLFHLKNSLPALARSSYSRLLCVLVDDRSTDGSLDFAKRDFPQIHIIPSKGKKGFAGSVNTGIGYALTRHVDYIAIANTDIKVPPGWIDSALTVFEREKNAGLVGFTEMSKEREELLNEHREVEAVYTEVKGVPGCLFICPARVFRDVGLFDEDYFMYGEDNDFFARLIRAGYRILQTDVPVWHYNEGSGQSTKFANAWLTYRNGIRYALKNENTGKVVRQCAALLYYGCNPLPMDQTRSPSLKRLRRYNVFVNLLLFVSACGWNLFSLPRTLRLRACTRRTLGRPRGNSSVIEAGYGGGVKSG